MTNTTKKTNLPNISDLRLKLLNLRVNIKAHQEKNTNAHKSLKKQLAQLLTNRSNLTN